MTGLLAGRRALVTGGATGLGATVVALFAAEGATGAVLDRTDPGGLPAGWTAHTCDVRSEESVATATAQAATAHGSFEVACINAGVVPDWQRTADIDLDTWDQVMAVNARGAVATLKHCCPYLTSPSSVVVTGSLNSWRGDPNIAAYAASKHAVLGLVRSAAMDLGPDGVRVNAVAPGPVATAALRDRIARRSGAAAVDDTLHALAERTALRRLATDEDVARTILFLASDLAFAVTGQVIPVDGGLL